MSDNVKCSDCDSVIRVNQEKRSEFESLAKPLIKFINDNYHPHVSINITSTHAELVEGLCAVNTMELIRD